MRCALKSAPFESENHNFDTSVRLARKHDEIFENLPAGHSDDGNHLSWILHGQSHHEEFPERLYAAEAIAYS